MIIRNLKCDTRVGTRSAAGQRQELLRKAVAKSWWMGVCIGMLFGLQVHLRAETTAFSYQGALNKGGSPVNGTYDVTFGLYPANMGGGLVGGVLLTNTVAVSNGLFMTTLDFGNVFDGGAYWLEMGVRSNSSGSFVLLAPRVPVHPVPYAQHAASASSLTGILSDGQISNNIPRLNSPTNNFSSTVVANAFAGDGSQLTNLPASAITSGTINKARLGSGTASSSTFLRGDGTWMAPGAGNGLQAVNNLNDLSNKAAAAQNVGILDMSAQTGMNGYDAKNNAIASFDGQLGISDWGKENSIIWRSRSTAKGDWYAIMSCSGGGVFVAGDAFSMSTNAAGHNFFWSMGNPALQISGAYRNIDAQNVAVNCNPYISGSGWLCAMVTTNAAHGWICISTNSNGEKIYKKDTFLSFLAVPEQSMEFDLPGFGLIVQNGNDPFALASSESIDGIIGNYSYFQTSPATHELLFPIWKANAWRPSSNNFTATRLNTDTGRWSFVSDITVSGAINVGTNGDITFSRDAGGTGKIGDGGAGTGALLHKWSVVSKSTNYMIISGEANRRFDNTGAMGTNVFTLPTSANGLSYTFTVTVPQMLVIKAQGTDAIRIAGSVSVTAGNIAANSVGNSVTLTCHNGVWYSEGHEGNWVIN